MFEKLLINEICKYPCIFDKKDPSYKNKIIREKAWAAVAAATKCSVSQCQGRWKTLRDRSVKEIKRESCPSGSGVPENCATLKFMAAHEFMRVHVAPRPTISSIQWDEDTQETSHVAMTLFCLTNFVKSFRVHQTHRRPRKERQVKLRKKVSTNYVELLIQ